MMITKRNTRRLQGLQPQQGAVAIEFMMLFMLFFALFYAMVNYAMVMLMQSAFAHEIGRAHV